MLRIYKFRTYSSDELLKKLELFYQPAPYPYNPIHGWIELKSDGSTSPYQSSQRGLLGGESMIFFILLN